MKIKVHFFRNKILLCLLFFLLTFVVSCEMAKSDSVDYIEPVVAESEEYILNVRSKKIHKVNCATAKRITAINVSNYDGELENLFESGFSLCGNCFK